MLSNFSGHVFHRNKTRCNIPALVLAFKPCSYLSSAAPGPLDTVLHLNPLCLQDLPHKPLSLPSATALKDKNFHPAHTFSIPCSLKCAHKLHSNRLMLPYLSNALSSSFLHQSSNHWTIHNLPLLLVCLHTHNWPKQHAYHTWCTCWRKSSQTLNHCQGPTSHYFWVLAAHQPFIHFIITVQF